MSVLYNGTVLKHNWQYIYIHYVHISLDIVHGIRLLSHQAPSRSAMSKPFLHQTISLLIGFYCIFIGWTNSRILPIPFLRLFYETCVVACMSSLSGWKLVTQNLFLMFLTSIPGQEKRSICSCLWHRSLLTSRH